MSVVEREKVEKLNDSDNEPPFIHIVQGNADYALCGWKLDKKLVGPIEVLGVDCVVCYDIHCGDAS